MQFAKRWHGSCSEQGVGLGENMLILHLERIGEMALIECEGRMVGSEAAFTLREAVNSQRDARIIALDLSELLAIGGECLDMLVFLQQWAHDNDIRLKLFNPRHSVWDSLAQISSMQEFKIATLDEMMALLAGADGRHTRVA
jgi:anti-anti-sigma regulatory factor